jgi:hypothetical protein
MFAIAKDKWLTPDSLPKQHLGTFDISKTPVEATVVMSRIPVIYGRTIQEEEYFSDDGSTLFIGLDIFGSAFFMLTRYEELVLKERDEHERFPATASLAYKEGFLSRPIINEYVEILWWALTQLDPELTRKKRQFSLDLSHDVDWPMTASQGPKRVLMSAVADIVRRKDPGLALRRLSSLPRTKPHRFDHDVNNTFDFIMTVSEEQHVTSTFNIIAGNTAGEIDGTYSLDDPWVGKMIQNFSKRGHKIGLHLSYNSFRDPKQTRQEFERLMQVCKELNIGQNDWGSRQHFLRWKNPTTWQNLEDAGLKYDSTLTYADKPGFRCGVCYEYPVFNLRKRKALKLREKPLIVMEGTLYDYMDLSREEADRQIISLHNRCKLFKGDFTLLWHNSSLIARQDKQCYRRIVDKVSA